jgi:hypothetical protein
MSLARALWVKTQASVSRSGRRRCQSRVPLAGVALESQLYRLCVASSMLGLVDVEAAASDGGCALRHRPRDPWWTDASRGSAFGCMDWVTVLCRSAARPSARLTRLRGGGSTFRPSRRRRMLVRRPWSTINLACAAWVVGACVACDIAARAQEVVHQDGGPGRWCWRSARHGRVDGCRGGDPESLFLLSASRPCVIWTMRFLGAGC